MNAQSLIATGIPWEKETVVPADTLNIIKVIQASFLQGLTLKVKHECKKSDIES